MAQGTSSYAKAAPGGTDPLEAVLDMGTTPSLTLVIILAFLAHVGLAGASTAATQFSAFSDWSRGVKAIVADKLAQTYEIETDKPAPPPPPPPEEKKDEPPPPPAQDTKQDQPKDEPPPPAPQAAQAGQVLTAAPDPNEPVDFTGNTFVQGPGTEYKGGTTQAGATGGPTYNPAARATGTPGGTGTAPPAPPKPAGPDLSKAAGNGSVNWRNAPFPSEADAEQIDDAYVMLRITTDASGRALKVEVVKDPGHGFGREAKAYAMRQSFQSAKDRDGNPVGGEFTVNVHFTR